MSVFGHSPVIQGPGPDLGWPGGETGGRGRDTGRKGDREGRRGGRRVGAGWGAGERRDREGERGGEERHTASRIGCFSAPSSHQEEQFGCTFTPKPAKLFSHRANELSFHNMDQSIVDSFDTLVCSQFWPLRLQKYWGSAWIKMPFHVNHGDPRVSLAGAV